MISAGMEAKPGEEADLDAWYREEHLDQATTQPGFKRSKRYTLFFHQKHESEPEAEDPPSGLALHEWDEGFLGEEVDAFQPVTEWTKRAVGNAKKIEAGNYELVKSYGGK